MDSSRRRTADRHSATIGRGFTGAQIALVSLGGGLGSMGRFWFWQEWPGVLRATFVTSVIGCFVLGICLGLSGRRSPVRLFAVGVCGGFASFSVYAVLGVAFATRWLAVVFLVVTPICALGSLAVGAYLSSRVRR